MATLRSPTKSLTGGPTCKKPTKLNSKERVEKIRRSPDSRIDVPTFCIWFQSNSNHPTIDNQPLGIHQYTLPRADALSPQTGQNLDSFRIFVCKKKGAKILTPKIRPKKGSKLL